MLSKKMSARLSAIAGTLKQIAHSSPKLSKVVTACSKKNSWALRESVSLSSRTFAHSRMAMFGMEIFASTKK